jgi:simple sugar transport system permease protein
VNVDLVVAVLFAALAVGAAVLLAALGELISEVAGVINIQIEGMMLAGAFAGVLGAYLTQSLVVGFVCAVAGALLIGALQGVACFVFGANQIVAGIVLNIFALGVTTYLLSAVLGTNLSGQVPSLPGLAIPGLAAIPVIGPALFTHNVVVYGALLLVPVVWWLLNRTTWGLMLKAVGERPGAAESLGTNVVMVRWVALLACAALSGVGGGLLTLGSLGFFTENVTAGRGFIALAAVVFGRWRPLGVLAAVLLFSIADAFQIRAQVMGLNLPYQFMVMLPYVVTVLAIAGLRRVRPPSALGVNYERA